MIWFVIYLTIAFLVSLMFGPMADRSIESESRVRPIQVFIVAFIFGWGWPLVLVGVIITGVFGNA